MIATGHQATRTRSGRFSHFFEDAVSKTRFWWVLLITGAAWIIGSILILRFDYTTVTAIAVLSVTSVWPSRSMKESSGRCRPLGVADNPSLTMTADGPTVNHDSWMATDTPMHAMRRAELRTTAPASLISRGTRGRRR